MRKGRKGMTENEIASFVVDASYHIHKRLGPGLLESVYEAILAYELRKRSLEVQGQVPVSVLWDDLEFAEAFRADLLIENKVIVELKSIEKIAPVHKKQLLSYLRLADIRLGLLINFGEEIMKHGIKRVVNGMPEANAED
jgi:GxxExxY protein